MFQMCFMSLIDGQLSVTMGELLPLVTGEGPQPCWWGPLAAFSHLLLAKQEV